MKAWFKISELQSKVGIITDHFAEYIELKEVERGKYYIVHEDNVTLINKDVLQHINKSLNMFYNIVFTI